MQNIYKTLFNFKILHRYFLDEGKVAFDKNNPTPDQERKLLNNYKKYNVADFLTVQPTISTARKIKNRKGRFMMTNEGFRVLMKAETGNEAYPFIEFPGNSEDLYFDFIVRIKDSFFENYTDLEIDRSKIYMISNRVPDSSGLDTAIDTEFQRISKWGQNPVSKSVDFGDDLTASELRGAFALIRLDVDGQGVDLNLTNNSGTRFNSTTPEFTIIYENRSTKWRYVDVTDNSVLFETSKNPLTLNGYVEAKHASIKYPNPDARLIVKQGSTFYSEVFIKS